MSPTDKVAKSKSTRVETTTVKKGDTVSVTRTTVVVEEVVIVPYGKHAGKTKFAASVPRDHFGNAKGPEYDLSPDSG